MKVLIRIVLFLLVLCVLAGLVGVISLFTPIPWLSVFVEGLQAQFNWMGTAISILLLACTAVCVLALILIVTVPSKRKLLIFDRERGKIEITRQSIESVAAASLDDIHEVKRYHVYSKGDMRPGKLKLDVQVEPRAGDTNLNELGSVVQQKLVQDLAANLAIEPKHIKVRIQQVRPSVEERRQHGKVPRVV